MAMTITITLDETGRVEVTGAIGNPLLAYGLLELARDVIAAQQAKAQASRILIPTLASVRERT